MEVSDNFNKFRFGTIKKEPTSEDEIALKHENSFHAVNQEHYSKPELHLDWDEKHNNDNLNPENTDGHCNKLFKLNNPRVLLERLPNSVLAKYCGRNTVLQCDHCSFLTKQESSLQKHIAKVHSDDLQACSKCKKKFKYKKSLRNHTTYCTAGTILQINRSFHATKKKNHSKKAKILKKFQDEKMCPKCKKMFRNRICLKKHLAYCGKKQNLQCEYCAFKTKYRSNLSHHMLHIHFKNLCEKKPHLPCDHCSYKTKNKSDLAKHITAVHVEKDVNLFLPCLKCGRRYKNQRCLLKHSYLCKRGSHFQCDYCSHKTKQKADLAKHIVAVHVEKDVNYFLPCSKCGKRYKNHQSLTRHSYLCGKERHLQCDNCCHKTKTKADLERHIVSAHMEKDVYLFLPCSKCGKRYKNQRSLIAHVDLCGKEPHFQCDYCSYKAKRKAYLANHIIAVHLEKDVDLFLPCSKCGKRCKNHQSLAQHANLCGNELHFQCDYCSHRTKTKADLAKHIVVAHVEKDVYLFLPCSKCGKRYKNQRSLITHVNLCGKEPHLQCDYCSYKVKRKADLAKHIIAVHLEKDVNLFLPCSKCGKRYKNQQSLTRHLYLCKKELHLQCDYCSHKNKTKADLAKHIIAVHLEKDVNLALPCSKCGKRYKNQQSLTHHLYSCGKDLHLQCDNCSYRTNYKTTLRNHILGVHLKRTTCYFLPCSKCGKTFKNKLYLKRHSKLCVKNISSSM